MATEKYVSQANFEHVWSNLSAMLDKKVSTNDSRLSDARVPRAHTHGNISNVGVITNNAVTVASGDSLLVGDASANNTIVKSSITFGSGSTFLRNDGTWATPTNTTYSDMKGATASAAGTHGLVPAPAVGAQAKFLRGDGTWQYTPNDNTTYNVFTGASSTTDGSTGLVPKPVKGDQSKYLRADGVWASPANTDTKVTTTLAATTKAYIAGTSNSATSTGTLIFDTGVYLDTTAGSLVATKFTGSLTGNADSATKATNDSLNNPITGYIKGLSISGRTITYTKGDGTTGTITTQDNNTTYNVFTGATSDAGGKNGLVPAPAVGQQNRFLKADGTWAIPVDTDTKVTNTLNTAAKAYLTGTTSATTNTGTQVFDTGVYLTENPGELHADKFVGAVSGNAETATSATKATNDAKDQAITGYVRGLSISGRTITYTKGDGTTGTLTTQDTNTTYGVFKAATASAAGGTGLVPAPAAGAQVKFLRGDGTWQVPTNTWRGIQDNLTSSSTDQSLSANQGKILKGLVDGKAPADHTHKYASGFSVSGTTVTVSYGDGTSSTFKTQDTNTTYTDMKGATADAAGAHGLVPAPAAGDQTKYLQANGTWTTPQDTTYGNFGGSTASAGGSAGLVPGPDANVLNQYLKSTGTWGQVAWGEISGKPSTFAPSAHTHNYAGSASAGGSANSAVKLDTATAGSTTQPVYFAGGKPVAIGCTIQSNVPANAKFTDTTYGVFKASTADAAGGTGLVPAPTKGQQGYYLAGDSTWKAFSKSTVGLGNVDNTADSAKSVKYATSAGSANAVAWGNVSGKPSTFTPSTHTHKYASGFSVSGTTVTVTYGDNTTSTFTTQDTNTDNKVLQTAVKSSDYTNWRTLIWGASNSATEGFDPANVTDSVFASSSLTCQPSTGTIRATTFKGNLSGTATNATNDAKDQAITSYIRGLSISGRTITYTKGDGTTGTITTQDTNTTYGVFKAATASAAGGTGLVPAPAAGAQTKYLRADGTWQTPPDTNTTYSAFKGATASAAGGTGLVPAPASGTINQYLKSTGAWGQVTWSEISGKPSTFTPSTHTHNYAGSSSAGGSANSANFLNKNTTFKATGEAGIQYYDAEIKGATDVKTDGWGSPTEAWYQIIHMPLSVGGYYNDIAIPVNDVNGIAYRQRRNNSYYGWYRLLDSNNWSNYVTKSSVGLGNVDNTADSAKSVKYATSAGSANAVAWGNVSGKPSTFTPASHTHKYASGFSVSGTTVTVSYGDGTSSTFTTQDTNTTYSDMKGATASAAGGTGLVPAPAAGAQAKYLRGDGTWQTPPDTNTTYSAFKGATASAAGGTGLVPAPASGTINQYLKSTGAWGQVTWSEISGKPSTFTPSTHTHNYAGSASAGGSANSAVKLDTAAAGSATQPVYFSGGKPTACTYTLGKSVPANAVFTDTHTLTLSDRVKGTVVTCDAIPAT